MANITVIEGVGTRNIKHFQELSEFRMAEPNSSRDNMVQLLLQFGGFKKNFNCIIASLAGTGACLWTYLLARGGFKLLRKLCLQSPSSTFYPSLDANRGDPLSNLWITILQPQVFSALTMLLPALHGYALAPEIALDASFPPGDLSCRTFHGF